MASPIPAALPTLPKSELASQLTELAGHLNAGTYRFLVLLAEFDRREAWSDGGTASCAHWLNWQCGIDLGAAREKVRVAHALEKLPRIAQAMAGGCLSYSKVRALTRVACEATEEVFLATALHGTASHVENLVRHFRRARESQELSREAQQQANRGLTYFHDDDGSLVLKCRVPAEIGAVVINALEAAAQELRRDVSAETCDELPTPSARRADALGAIAESFLKHGIESLSGGDRQQIVVHVDADTLHDGTAGRCELEDGPSLPAETARRLACDASVVRMAEDAHGNLLDVGRKTRSIPPALRRALRTRDLGCRFPGCPNTRYLDGHHVRHWAQGGETKLSNLVSLCRFHHRQVHEGRVLVQRLDDGAWRFVKPDGRSFDSVARGSTAPLADWTHLVAAHQQQGSRIDPHTAATLWRGESIDYSLAVDVLLSRAERAARVSAETSQHPVLAP
jgi:hypothetical protein